MAAMDKPVCREFQHEQMLTRVPLLIAGKLSATDIRAVLWHLAHCDDCFAVYQRLVRAPPRQARLPAAVAAELPVVRRACSRK
jgi:hypothetical protein